MELDPSAEVELAARCARRGKSFHIGSYRRGVNELWTRRDPASSSLPVSLQLYRCSTHRDFLSSLIFGVTPAPVFHFYDYRDDRTCLQEAQMFGVT